MLYPRRCVTMPRQVIPQYFRPQWQCLHSMWICMVVMCRWSMLEIFGCVLKALDVHFHWVCKTASGWVSSNLLNAQRREIFVLVLHQDFGWIGYIPRKVLFSFKDPNGLWNHRKDDPNHVGDEIFQNRAHWNLGVSPEWRASFPPQSFPVWLPIQPKQWWMCREQIGWLKIYLTAASLENLIHFI